MSGSNTPKETPKEPSQAPLEKPSGGPQGDQDDLAMEDILASIRRILKEDTEAEPPRVAERNDVLLLDESMMVAEPKPPASTLPAAPPVTPEAPTKPAFAIPPETKRAESLVTEKGNEATAPNPGPERLLAPEAAAATANSLGSLVRTLVNERGTLVHRGGEPRGPTIEDMVREELRPFLKAWLDQHLPALVERVVRAEIDRLLGNSLS